MLELVLAMLVLALKPLPPELVLPLPPELVLVLLVPVTVPLLLAAVLAAAISFVPLPRSRHNSALARPESPKS
jgi:hypothetical protein